MTYETAKRLKDAGFPQGNFSTVMREHDVAALSPTLSELIRACGMDIEELKHDTTGFKLIKSWAAFGKDSRGDGNTPEEAVSNLYLALNKKDNA